jgi:hypothetical protein
MSYDTFTESCGPGGNCGSCVTPCFLRVDDDSEAFESLVEQDHEPAYDELADAMGDTDTFALGCSRWDEPESDCRNCDGNFFCFYGA